MSEVPNKADLFRIRAHSWAHEFPNEDCDEFVSIRYKGRKPEPEVQITKSEIGSFVPSLISEGVCVTWEMYWIKNAIVAWEYPYPAPTLEIIEKKKDLEDIRVHSQETLYKYKDLIAKLIMCFEGMKSILPCIF